MTCPKCGYTEKGRSTGPYSQNNHFFGHVAGICKETGNDMATVKDWIKREAMARGYGFTILKGRAIPKSTAQATVAECSILIEVAHQLAAEYGIRLEEGGHGDGQV